MVISRKRSLSLHPPPILVNSSPLMLVNNEKYLGIQINYDLSWSPHVTSLCIKARRLIGLLYRHFYKHAASSTLLQLYKSFIRPHLEFCSVVWNPYLVCDIESLEKVQRFALRVCLKNWSASHDQLYNVSPLSASCILMQVSATCKLVNNLIVYPNSPIHFRVIQYNSRHKFSCPTTARYSLQDSSIPACNDANAIPIRSRYAGRYAAAIAGRYGWEGLGGQGMGCERLAGLVHVSATLCSIFTFPPLL